MNESLEKVEHDLCFAADGLREALHRSTAVEAMIIIPLIKQVEEIKRDVAALFTARIADARQEKLI